MAKWRGKVGLVYDGEDPVGSGIYKHVIRLLNCKGDVTRSSRRWENASNQVNDNITINNEIRILARQTLLENVQMIRFISFMGGWWEVNSVTLDYPTITLEIGGVYNGDTTPTPG